MSELKSPIKSHDIPKLLVWGAWLKVKENGGAAGADGVSIPQFEVDLKGNLYKLWNRMSSGSYFPGAVRAVEIPKKGGTRVLGIPNVVDRVAQTVVLWRWNLKWRRFSMTIPTAIAPAARHWMRLPLAGDGVSRRTGSSISTSKLSSTPCVGI